MLQKQFLLQSPAKFNHKNIVQCVFKLMMPLRPPIIQKLPGTKIKRYQSEHVRFRKQFLASVWIIYNLQTCQTATMFLLCSVMKRIPSTGAATVTSNQYRICFIYSFSGSSPGNWKAVINLITRIQIAHQRL